MSLLRHHPKTGKINMPCLKPISRDADQLVVDTDTGIITEFAIGRAHQEEIDNTVAVIGGEHWQM